MNEYGFARITRIDGHAVEMSFQIDPGRYPAFSLPAQHPVLIGAYQYYGSVLAGRATGAIPEGQSSAIVGLSWSCPDSEVRPGYAVRAVGRFEGTRFELHALDQANRPVFDMQGEGKIFDDRDFAAWRDSARASVTSQRSSEAFNPAPPESLGLSVGGVAFLSSPMADASPFRVDALVGSKAGFYPVHAYHTGSGDHVNAPHMFDCVLQAAHLFLGSKHRLRCMAGEGRFNRFVELDAPFAIILERHALLAGDELLEFRISQNGRNNAALGVRLERRT